MWINLQTKFGGDSMTIFHLWIAYLSFAFTLWLSVIYSLVQWRNKEVLGQKIVSLVALSFVDLTLLIGTITSLTNGYFNWIHVFFAISAVAILHYINAQVKKNGLNLKLVLLTWLVPLLLILAPTLGWIILKIKGVLLYGWL